MVRYVPPSKFRVDMHVEGTPFTDGAVKGSPACRAACLGPCHCRLGDLQFCWGFTLFLAHLHHKSVHQYYNYVANNVAFEKQTCEYLWCRVQANRPSLQLLPHSRFLHCRMVGATAFHRLRARH